MLLGAGVYALDPQRTHLPLLRPPVAVGILQRLLHALTCNPDAVLRATPEALLVVRSACARNRWRCSCATGHCEDSQIHLLGVDVSLIRYLMHCVHCNTLAEPAAPSAHHLCKLEDFVFVHALRPASDSARLCGQHARVVRSDWRLAAGSQLFSDPRRNSK